jgi:hypothetical protein
LLAFRPAKAGTPTVGLPLIDKNRRWKYRIHHYDKPDFRDYSHYHAPQGVCVGELRPFKPNSKPPQQALRGFFIL